MQYLSAVDATLEARITQCGWRHITCLEFSSPLPSVTSSPGPNQDQELLPDHSRTTTRFNSYNLQSAHDTRRRALLLACPQILTTLTLIQNGCQRPSRHPRRKLAICAIQTCLVRYAALLVYLSTFALF